MDIENADVPDFVVRIAKKEVRMPSREDYSLDICSDMNPEWETILCDEKLRSYACYLRNPFDEHLLKMWWEVTMDNIRW